MTTPLTSVFKGRRVVVSQIVTTTPYTLTDKSPEDISVDATSGAKTINLPLISTVPGQAFTIRKYDTSSNIVTVSSSGGELIEGGTTINLIQQWQSATFTNDGVKWYRSSTNATGTGGALPGVSPAQVLFADAGSVATGSALFKWDDTNKRLGVNKATPTVTLDVVGQGAFTGTLTASNLSGTNTGDSKQEIHITLLAAGVAVTF